MEKLNDRGNNIPCLYGAIVLSFPPDTVAEVLDQVLPQGTRYRKYPECTECVMTEIRDFYNGPLVKTTLEEIIVNTF